MRGYFGIGIYNTKTALNVGTLWRSAFILGASYIFTIGKRYSNQCSDTVKAHRHIPLFEYQTFDDFKISKDCKLIGIELDEKSTPLERFVHPERACYLLGAEDHGIPEDILNKCYSIVQLPGDYCMNVAVAGSIVMYDRLYKSK